MADINQIRNDPEFQKLSKDAKIMVLKNIDPNYRGLSSKAQGIAVDNIAPVLPKEDPQYSKENPMPLGEMSTQAITNIPSSALETVKSMATPFIHPVETAKGLGRLAAGGVQKIIPGEQGYEKSFDQFTDFMKERYGGIENIKQTIAKDPVGFTTDIASFFTGGGAVLKGVGTAGKVGRLVQAGKTIQKIGGRLDPANIVSGAIVPTAKLIPQEKINRLYQGAAKFSTVADPKVRNLITKTALENNIMPTVKGLDKTKNLITDLQDQITNKIGAVDQAGHVMPIDDLFKNFDELKNNIKAVSSDPMSEVRQYEVIEKSIRKANEDIGRGVLTPSEVQKIKVDTHRKLSKQYEKTMTKPAKVEARMAVAKASRDYLELIIPEIKGLNAKEGALLELNKRLAKSSNRISNRDVIGIGIPIKAGVGAAIGGVSGSASVAGMGATIGVITGLLDTPVVKAQIAIILNTLKNKGIKIKPTQAAIRLGLFQAGRVEQEGNR